MINCSDYTNLSYPSSNINAKVINRNIQAPPPF